MFIVAWFISRENLETKWIPIMQQLDCGILSNHYKELDLPIPVDLEGFSWGNMCEKSKMPKNV